MKRLHVHVGVKNLDEAIGFYSSLFGAEPVKRKPDYAKWMLDDPRVNFAISTRASQRGVDHLGIQVDEAGELNEIRERLKRAELTTFGEGETVCCYARSDKSWVLDPTGTPWETYQTMEDAEVYHGADAAAGACCTADSSAAEGGARCGEPAGNVAMLTAIQPAQQASKQKSSCC